MLKQVVNAVNMVFSRVKICSHERSYCNKSRNAIYDLCRLCIRFSCDFVLLGTAER